MRASSMRALDKVAGEFSQRLAESGVEAAAWGKALFVMVDVLRHNSRLTNSLTDPGRPVTDKQELARGVFGTSAPAPAVDIVCQLVASRWSEAKDLAEAVEDLAVQALLAAAASQGQLEIIGRDLFAVTELLKEQRELRNALAEVRTRTATERVEILTRILQGKIHPYALTILKRMVDTSTGTGLRGEIKVSVTVSGGRISAIEVLSYEDDEQFFTRAESGVIDSVIAAQSAEVDAVSGATFSSNGIMEAVANALGQEYTNTNSSASGGGHGHGGRH